VRSLQPDPGNPWPHDMVLTINNDDQGLLELLWVRDAGALRPSGDVPPPIESTPEFSPSENALRGDKRELEQAWTELWSAVLAHAGKRQDNGLFEKLQAAPFGSRERQELLDEVFGPSWRGRFGDALFDDEYERWVRSVGDETHREGRLPLEQHPERRCLEALVPAWKRGLSTVVVIPCVGDYTRTVGAHGLSVTRGTRSDPDRYAEALRAFGR
jgi:hypothetical protein